MMIPENERCDYTCFHCLKGEGKRKDVCFLFGGARMCFAGMGKKWVECLLVAFLVIQLFYLFLFFIYFLFEKGSWEGYD